MKAIQIKATGPAENLVLVDVPDPKPGRGQVLVKVAAASINYLDVLLRAGHYPVDRPLPWIPGVECGGTVAALGDGVKGLSVGQRVMVLGKHNDLRCYAELMVADAADATLLPDGVDLGEAAALPVVYLTAWHALHTMGHAHAGQTALLHAAAGGVGTALTQLAKLSGLKTIGLTSTDEKVAFALEAGLDHAINYRTADVTARVRELTGGRGVDLSFNSVGGDTLARDLDLLAPFGQIIWYGMAAGPPPDDLTRHLSAGFGKSTGIRAFLIYNVANFAPNLMAESKLEMLRMLAAGKIRPVIHARYPLAEAAEAHRQLEAGKVMGKLILEP
jgi:NADPH2:quinone reductase